ncbi:MAG: hypothetical protein M1812_004506 [Candelaria pacifica]|nr:MAG: hypothetical protein M1812_004506 [Candelaria pacifica]
MPAPRTSFTSSRPDGKATFGITALNIFDQLAACRHLRRLTLHLMPGEHGLWLGPRPELRGRPGDGRGGRGASAPGRLPEVAGYAPTQLLGGGGDNPGRARMVPHGGLGLVVG